MPLTESSAGEDSEVQLVAPASNTESLASFLNASVRLSGGLAIMQIKARLNQEEVDVLANTVVDDVSTASTPLAFSGQILAPYANRIAGELSPDGQIVRAEIRKPGEPTVQYGCVAHLPAHTNTDGGELHRFAMHGLLPLLPSFSLRNHSANRLEAFLHAADFGGRWPSLFDISFSAEIASTAFTFAVTATNVGAERAPIGIGWHPYFALPSGLRAQARMHIPSTMCLNVNNYRDVLPTGDIVSVRNSERDFSAQGGALFSPTLHLDDCYVHLAQTANGHTVSEIMDAASGYALRIIATSPQVTAIQTYSPMGAPYIAIEPQFNWTDPFGSQWSANVDTGMVWLPTGASVTYAVRLELFSP